MNVNLKLGRLSSTLDVRTLKATDRLQLIASFLREVCALGFAGGHLLLEDDVKKQILFEPQASLFALAIESQQVAEKSRATPFCYFCGEAKVNPAAAIVLMTLKILFKLAKRKKIVTNSGK